MPITDNGSTLDTRSPGCLDVAVCKVCGALAPFLCDYEVAPGKTCDAPLCGRCRVSTGVKDYCPEHAGKPVKRFADSVIIDDDEA